MEEGSSGVEARSTHNLVNPLMGGVMKLHVLTIPVLGGQVPSSRPWAWGEAPSVLQLLQWAGHQAAESSFVKEK